MPDETCGRLKGTCVRCRRIKIKCTYSPANQDKCRSCSRGDYECIYLTKAERTAQRQKRRRLEGSSDEGIPYAAAPSSLGSQSKGLRSHLDDAALPLAEALHEGSRDIRDEK